MNGRSPWTFTNQSALIFPATSAKRSVPRAWSVGSHSPLPPKPWARFSHPPVVRCHHHPIQPFRFGGVFVNVLDHWFAADPCQRLSRKPGRTIARRNNCHNGHQFTVL